MKKNLLSVLICAAALAAASSMTSAGETDGWSEADFRDALCSDMRTEVRLGNFGIADCVSDTHAIEVDWADKFKEGVGQALTYSTTTTLIPGLILICRRSESSCLNHSLAAQEVLSAYGAEATIWECANTSTALSDCQERHLKDVP